jgi:hypothetical protein
MGGQLMNGPRNNPVNDNDLTNTLNQRADDFARLGGQDLDLSQVVSRAGEIRRGRRMRASMMMAAVVVAVAVPIGITVIGNDSPNRPNQPPIASNSATPSPSVDKSPLGLGELAIGDTTEVGLADNTKIYLPDGSLSLNGNGETRALAWVGSGFLVARDDGSGSQTVSYVGIGDAGTDLTWSYGGSGFAVSSDRRIGAFVEADGTVRVVQDSGSLNFALGTLPADSYVVDAVQGENCSGRSDLGSDCMVYLHSVGQHPAIWVAAQHQAPRKVTEPEFHGFLKFVGISAHGDLAGMTSATDSGSCWAVRNSDGNDLWTTCKYSLTSFSGDGQYVLATGAYQSGAGDSSFVVLNARTGEVVLDLTTAKDAFVAQRAWEDGNHVIATVYDHGVWGVVRIDVTTGERQYAGALDSNGDELTVSDSDPGLPAFQLSASR